MPSYQSSLEREKLSDVCKENSELRKKLWEVSSQLVEIEKLFNELYSLCLKTTSKQDNKKKT